MTVSESVGLYRDVAKPGHKKRIAKQAEELARIVKKAGESASNAFSAQERKKNTEAASRFLLGLRENLRRKRKKKTSN